MNGIVNLSRREFLKAGAAVSGGLLLGFRLPLDSALAEPAGAFATNAFLRIDPAGAVTALVPQSEMGQGVLTSLPMLLAEELEADWKTVRFEQTGADKVYTNPIIGTQLTGGSSSVRGFWEPLGRAGAAARTMLIAAAAKAWRVDAASCHAENGTVAHGPSGRKLTYGELADRAALQPVPKDIKLKSPDEYRLLGKGLHRLDTPLKVTGSAVFGLDVKRPGLLTAAVERCPVFGGKAAGYNEAAARSVPGVRHVVPIASGVAVVADSYWAAKKGRDALGVRWDEGPLANLSSGGITRMFEEASKQEGLVARNEENASKVLGASSRKIEAVYRVPYLAHATMEPMNCTAHVQPGRCEIWAPTQAQGFAQQTAAKLTGLPPEAVFIHTTYLGGGFGRRAEQDFLAEAVEISKAIGAPVKVVWTREDDIRHDHYRPAMVHRFTAALGADGMPAAWMHRIVGPSILATHGMLSGGVDRTSVEGAANLPYEIPNLRVEYVQKDPGVPVGFWRSVGSSHNAFVTECFFDELASTAGKDPYEMRRMLLRNHPRHLGVLELAAAKAGWGSPLPKDRYRGIAVAESFKSFVAQVAEVSVADDGTVRVHRVVCATDCGLYVNPDTVEAQMQGGIVFGLTAALMGAITLEKGKVREGNFDDYPMLRMLQMPAVEVHLVRNREAPGGVGEPGVPPIAPAVANAVFAARGKRIRVLPLRQEDLKKSA
jgi:isoquinoline 1-oxidoreductase beta subunit